MREGDDVLVVTGEYAAPILREMFDAPDGAFRDRVEAVADDIAKYLGSDLLFYRAGHPEALVAREAALWDLPLFWAAGWR